MCTKLIYNPVHFFLFLQGKHRDRMSHVTYAVTEMSQVASVGEMQIKRLPIHQEINIMMFQKKIINYAAKSIK